MRKAVGHLVCFLSLWIRLKKYDFAGWLVVQVICQQMRISLVQERDEELWLLKVYL